MIDLTIKEMKEKLKNKDMSSVELTEAYLDNISKEDETLGAYITVTRDIAINSAKQADEKINNGEMNSLTGIPYGIKDNICTNGIKTTCASKMLEGFTPVYDAFVYDKLKREDTVLLGKLNMDEFAMGSSNENSAFKIPKNPHNHKKVTGGSSGGSAAAVAGDLAPFTLGSDTGGSIRQPASFCGVVGLKPTYGSVSRNGLIAFASSLDQIGPITKNVYDNALVYNAISGHDKLDSTSINTDKKVNLDNLSRGVKGIKIAIPKEYLGKGIDEDVKTGILEAAKVYESLGARVDYVSFKTMDYALPAYYIISSAEVSSNLARFDGVRYGYRTKDYETIEELYKKSRSEAFGKEVKRRIMLGSFALSSGYYDAYYKKALQVRSMIIEDFQNVFNSFDVILSPVAPTTAYNIGSKTTDPLEMYLGDIYTVPVNIGGLPALSMPCGKDRKGMPIGMQLIGPNLSEELLYTVGNAFYEGGIL